MKAYIHIVLSRVIHKGQKILEIIEMSFLVNKQNVVYNEILLNNKKEFQNHYAERSQTHRQHKVWFHPHEISRKRKLIETESGSVVCGISHKQAWEHFLDWHKFSKPELWGWLHKLCWFICLKFNELRIYNGCILCYDTSTKLFLRKKNRSKRCT